MPSPTPVATKGTLSRYVMPIGLFLAIIGGTAWLTQYLPNWRNAETVKSVTGPSSAGKPVIQLSRNFAVWETDEDGKNTGYVREYERGVEGHYDFPFKNVLRAAAELGLLRVSCDCTYIKVCLLPPSEWERVNGELDKDPAANVSFTQEPTWHKVTADDHHGVKIPADAQGLVRVTWNGRKGTGEQLRIMLQIWAQPEGDEGGRQLENIGVPVVMAYPVQYDPGRQYVGILGPSDVGKAEFYLWSATRGPDELKVGVAELNDPLLSTETRPLSPDECKRLADRLKEKKLSTKVRAGFLLTANVYESRSGQQREQGPFGITLPLLVDELPVEFRGPLVTGSVKGDVEVGSLEEQGKIDLKSFSAAEGTRRTVTVYSKLDQDLQVESYHPPALQVKLTKVGKDAALGRMRWNLQVAVPPNGFQGTFGEQGVIILRILGNPPRLIRVPVLGTAAVGGQG